VTVIYLYGRENDPERPLYPDNTLSYNLKLASASVWFFKSNMSSSDLQNDDNLDLVAMIFDGSFRAWQFRWLVVPSVRMVQVASSS
jgi:hypothetical protein